EALCPHFLQCGGCALQHLSEEAQIRFKQETWLEQFKHFGHVEPEEVLPPLQGPQYHYRHKARLGVRYVIKKGKVVIGFRERFNHYVADLNSCHILPKLISSLIPKLSNLIAELSCYQEIPQI